MMSVDDLETDDLPELDWSHPEQALSLLYRHALNHARNAEAWYSEKRRPKKTGGQALRITAILLFGLAALIPILSEVIQTDGQPVIPPAWASAALVIGATLVALDRYFGFSFGWTRFMSANLSIARSRRSFEFEWQELQATGRGDPLEHVKLVQRFVSVVDQIVLDETKAWSDEFRAALDSTARGLERQPETSSG
jgi:hypothetical protein